jgi:uncharacterized protein (DUF433 family)
MELTIVTETAPLVADHTGSLRVGDTRVTLDTVVYAFQEGATAEEIAQQYPSLLLADIYGAIAYYLRHREEIEAYLLRREQRAREQRAVHEALYNPVGIRERLLARNQRGH